MKFYELVMILICCTVKAESSNPGTSRDDEEKRSYKHMYIPEQDTGLIQVEKRCLYQVRQCFISIISAISVQNHLHLMTSSQLDHTKQIFLNIINNPDDLFIQQTNSGICPFQHRLQSVKTFIYANITNQ